MIRLAYLGDAPVPVAQLVLQTAVKYGVDPQLALNVARRESGLNPNAQSPAGAQGVMQLMPPTAASLGVTNPFDPVQNVDAGVRYLAQLLAKYPDTATALAAYNWGPGSVDKARSVYGQNWWSVAPQETLDYVAAILGSAPAVPAQPGGDTVHTGAGPLTIDNDTGQPVADAADVSTLPYAGGQISTSPNTLLLTALAAGVFLLADLLSD